MPREKYNTRSMNKSQKITFGIILSLICVLSIAILMIGNQAYSSWAQKPLGPMLDYPTPWDFPATWTVFPGEPQPTPLATGTLAPTLVFETETPSSPFLSCNNVPPMILLAIGSDARSDEYKYGRADVIRAIRVDFGLQKITVLAFPRDLWVKIPEVKDNLGTNQQKLNTAYYWGNPGLHYWDHPSEGPGLLALTMDRNFGLKPDHYIAVSMNVFVNVVDALGGLDIYLEEEVDGRYSYDQSKRLYFPAGEQHLSGEQALTLARTRNVSTFARTGHQNKVMCELQKKIREPETLTKIPEIIAAFQDNIQTDLTPGQISQLACLGTQIPMSNIIFSSFPRNMFRSGTVYDPVGKQNTFIWKSDFDALRAYVDEFEAGRWPTLDTSSLATPEPGTSGCE